MARLRARTGASLPPPGSAPGLRRGPDPLPAGPRAGDERDSGHEHDRHEHDRHDRDGGFSLVEVVVAVGLLSILMTAVAVLFVGGMRHGSGLQRRQAAVTVAQQALESVRAVTVLPDALGCVKLVQGRSRAAVDAQWASLPAAVRPTDTTPAYGCGGPLVVPLTGVSTAAGTVVDPVLLNGLSYSVTTLIGTCRSTGAATDACTSAGAGPLLYRVVVVVAWTGPGCAAGCRYSAATLLDPSVDPVYNVRSAGPPVAVPDSLCFSAGVPAAFSIVANDTGALGRRPVTVVAAGAPGRVGSTIATGVATYDPGSTPGTDSFTYKLTDVNGAVSGTATVSVTIRNGTCP